MKTITFECETITPMFLAGADGQTPELRPPSIKGALRFWWRAMNGHLKLEDLKKQESSIFGGTDSSGRSKLIIKVLNQPTNENIKNDYPTPHKESPTSKPFSKPSIKAGFNFRIQLSVIDNELLSLKNADNLFEFFSIVGGLGNRSRRGFGAFKIIKKDNVTLIQDESIENIKRLCNLVAPNFEINKNYTNKFPYVKDFKESTKNFKELLKDIGKITHEFNQKYGFDYGDALGKAKGGRFASPVYVSVIKKTDGKLKPIVTLLNTVPPKGFFKKAIQDEFIKAITE